MKTIQLFRRDNRCFNLVSLLLGVLAFATVPCDGQVTASQITNGLVSYYPLDQLVPGTTNATPDVLGRRDLTMYLGSMSQYQNGPATLIGTNVSSHPGMGDSVAVMNLPQTPAPTVLVYQSTGQNPLDGSGDFLPFINQRNATMNFWMKGSTLTPNNDQRVMAECANNGDAQAFFSLSTQPASRSNNGLGYFLRENVPVTDPNGVSANQLYDGTYQDPAFNYVWSQSSQYTTNVLFDNNWHMLTTVISSNGDVHVFVDGNYDPGNQSTATTDNEGNPALAPPIAVTNTYYNTNIYPFGPMTTNGGPGLPYVHWMIPGLNVAGAFTTFGGFDRNGGIAGGPPIQLSDIGYWNRALSQAEIQFVMTNGVPPPPGPLPSPPRIYNFSADFREVGAGNTVTINWNVGGASSSPGGIVITGIGDVSSNPIGSTNVQLGNNASYTFKLTAHYGLVADQIATVTVQTLAGVPSDWHLIQRWDGLFGNTTAGINGNGWISLLGYYAGNLDRFNVVTVNGNKVISPKSGYFTDTANSPVGYDSAGALSYGVLNGLTIPPFQKNTLFFRFTVTPPTPTAYAGIPPFTSIYSGLDFALGITDFGFATGPIGGTTPTPGGGGNVGPGIHILSYDSNGQFQGGPFNLTADNYSGSNVINSYSYVADTTNGSASGLLTNITYYCWLDVSNNNTMQQIIPGSPPITNTINEPLYSFWIQKQGDPGRTQLFSNYGGDRSWANAGQNSDFPTPYLNKVYVSVATENLNNSDSGAFFGTNSANMIMVDDFYLSSPGYHTTIPRLFNINSVIRNPTNAVIQWESLGSMLQLNTYSVQRTLSLNPAAWTTLTNGMPSGGDFTSFTDNTVGSSPTAFYRITWP